jgi:hypothetical protein
VQNYSAGESKTTATTPSLKLYKNCMKSVLINLETRTGSRKIMEIHPIRFFTSLYQTQGLLQLVSYIKGIGRNNPELNEGYF